MWWSCSSGIQCINTTHTHSFFFSLQWKNHYSLAGKILHALGYLSKGPCGSLKGLFALNFSNIKPRDLSSPVSTNFPEWELPCLDAPTWSLPIISSLIQVLMSRSSLVWSKKLGYAESVESCEPDWQGSHRRIFIIGERYDWKVLMQISMIQ